MDQARAGQCAADEIREFHEHLIRMANAGVPIRFGAAEDQSALRLVASIQHSLTRLASAHEFDSIVCAPDLPESYRTAITLWLQGNRTEALDLVVLPAESRRYLQRAIGFVLMQCLMLLGGVFLGLVAVCVWLFPIMEQLQSETFTSPGIGIRSLGFLAGWLPFWGVLLPVATALAYWKWSRVLSYLYSIRSPTERQQQFAIMSYSLHGASGNFQWLVTLCVLVCGVAVLFLALAVFGTTVELMVNSLDGAP